MEQSQTSSRRVAIIGVAVVVVVVIIALVAYALFNTTKKVTPTASKTTTTQAATVATKAQVQQNLSELNTAMKQAAADQATAKSALNDSKNQIKVGN